MARNKKAHENAMLLAVTEVLPAAWRDLSEVLDGVRGIGELLSRNNIGEAPLITHIREHLDYGRVEYWEKHLHSLQIDQADVQMISVKSNSYPRNLREVEDRPPFLFALGKLTKSDDRALAIVGSRRASDQGLRVAFEIAEAMAREGITVVSGLARGIDTAAHEGALHGKGRTIAVLGSGIDRIAPSDSIELAARIQKNGCVISQFKPGSPPTRSSFPMRNAVISGLSRASLIVECAERSGTRIEAEHSLRQGRLVLLWEPLMGGLPWVTRLVGTPGVELVNGLSEILAFVDSSERSD